MDSAKLEDLLQQLAEIVFNIDRDITEIKVSIAALKTFTAVQAEPNDPKAGMLRIESLEAEERKVDLRRLGLLEPFLELAEWVAREISLGQSCQRIIFSLVGEGHARDPEICCCLQDIHRGHG